MVPSAQGNIPPPCGAETFAQGTDSTVDSSTLSRYLFSSLEASKRGLRLDAAARLTARWHFPAGKDLPSAGTGHGCQLSI